MGPFGDVVLETKDVKIGVCMMPDSGESIDKVLTRLCRFYKVNFARGFDIQRRWGDVRDIFNNVVFVENGATRVAGWVHHDTVGNIFVMQHAYIKANPTDVKKVTEHYKTKSCYDIVKDKTFGNLVLVLKNKNKFCVF